MTDKSWKAIFDKYKIHKHEFSQSPYVISAGQIKSATAHFKNSNGSKVRVLCNHNCREDRPDVFVDNELFLLPIKNGLYAIIQGEGYIDIPVIKQQATTYHSKLDFDLDTAKVGDSEMQHLDFAYAASLIRTFLMDDSLVLTIRGRKYTPEFQFKAGGHLIEVKSVQTEVDAGYEGKTRVALVEAKNGKSSNVIIRQLFYPLRQWSHHTKKEVVPIFFEKQGKIYSLWHFRFNDYSDYNSIELVKASRFEIA